MTDMEMLRDRAQRNGFTLQQNDDDPALWALLKVGGGAVAFGGTLDEIEGWLEAFEREQA